MGVSDMLKKIILALFILFCLSGCGSGFDSYECYISVVSEYPGAIVKRLPGERYKFLVLDNKKVIYVETMAWGTRLTKIEEVFLVK